MARAEGAKADGAKAGGPGPVKRSLTLSGHRSSVTLEPPFWAALGRMARERGLSLNALASEIDAARPPGLGLASALRVAALDWALGQPMVASAGKVSSSQ